MKKITLLIFVFTLFVFYNHSFSQENDSLYTLNPEGFVAQKICDKRIVMFGEGIGHGHPVSNFCFIRILNTWLEMVTASDTSNNNLAIIFEMDSDKASRLKQYIYSGEIQPLMDFGGIQSTFEYLEFYYNLKTFKQRIDSINTNRKHKVSLDIKGFELIGENVNDEFYKMNQKDGESWFVNERDKSTSEGAIRYLKNNPNYKAFFFYGNAHLNTGFINKRFWNMCLPDEDCMGYCLAQYLVDAFGKENIERVTASSYSRYVYDNSPLDTLFGKCFLFLKPYEVEKLHVADPDLYGYCIILPEITLTIHKIQYILNRKVIEKNINQIYRGERLLPGYKAQIMLNPLYTLKALLDNDFIKANDIKIWYDKKNFNALKYLDSKDFHDNIMKYYLTHFSWQNLDYFLGEVGFTNDYKDSSLSPTSRAWFEKNWDKALKNIKIINSIGTMWAGYPDEQKEAKEFLKSVSGKDFNEPAEYLEWWRRDYQHLGI